jgi:hypothetical protein
LSMPDGDILIHAGDFMAFGDAPKEIVDFNHWIVIGPAITGPIGDLRKLEHGNRKRGQFQLCSVSLARAW